MRLFYEAIGLDIELEEGGCCGIIYENPTHMKSFVSDIWKQYIGKDETIFISEKDKLFKMGKEIEVIINPFNIDCNDRKIISKLYNEMVIVTNDDLVEEKTKVNSTIVSYMDTLINRLPYPLNFELDIDLIQLFKICSCKLDFDDLSLVDNIINYIKITHQILNYRVYIFTHLHTYLSEEEIGYIQEIVKYEHVNIIFVETIKKNTMIKERWWIIDEDKCIINI